MIKKDYVPVAENMWREKDGEIYLIGSTCEDCGEIFFPQKDVSICSHCYSNLIKEIEIKGTGVIHAVTNVAMAPAGEFYKGPVPFIYVIVEMTDGVYVPGHFIGSPPEEVKIGDKVKIVLDNLFEDENEIIMSYKFTHI